MIARKLGAKVLGLCALVVGVMAIGGAGVAQAEVGACWGYNNPSVEKLECFSKTLEAKPTFEIENKSGTLLIEKQTISILCTTMEFDEGGQLSAEGSVLLGRIKFKGCVGLINGVISKPCEPNDPVSGVGTILTEKFTALIRLHELVGGEKDPTVLVKPDEGETLAKIHLGPECAVAEELIVKGELVLADHEGTKSFEEHKVTHLFEEFKALQLMKVGVNKATLDGSTNVALAGEHAGIRWGSGLTEDKNTDCWGYNNPSVEKLECFSKTLEAKPTFEIENKSGTLLIEKQTISILCTAMEFDEGGQLSAEGSVLLGRAKFTGCLGLINGVISKPCTPNDPISGLGTILTQKFTALIQLHELVGGEKDLTILVKPDENETLAKIHIGEECAVGEELIVKGEFVLADHAGTKSLKEHKVTHLFEEFKALQLLKVGLNKATLDGSANVALGGEHAGFKWSGKAA